jgi:hypothetical protein
MAEQIVRIKSRRDSKIQWEAINPILLEGELGIEKGTEPKVKVGNGIDTWNDLPYLTNQADLQEAIDIINSEIGGIDGRLVLVEGKIIEIEGDISLVESDITDAQGRLNSIETIINPIPGQIAGLTNDLDTERTNRINNDTTLQGNINTVSTNLSTEIANRTNEITRVEGIISNEKTRAEGIESGLNTRLNTAEGNISSLQTSVNTTLPNSIATKTISSDTTDNLIDLKQNNTSIVNNIPNKSYVDTAIASVSSLVVDGNDKVLTIGTDGIIADITLDYTASSGELKLIGKNNTIITTIDLPLEQVLVSAAYNNTTHILTFTWNTDPETTTDVDLTYLIDVYEAGDGLNLDTTGTNPAFKILIDGNSTSGIISVSSTGLKIDLSNYSTTTEMNAAIESEKDRAEGIEDDLQTAIDEKQDILDDTNIKTIDGNSILGSGNLETLQLGTTEGTALEGNTTAEELGGYVKPEDGIPDSDFDENVQFLLGLASSAIQNDTTVSPVYKIHGGNLNVEEGGQDYTENDEVLIKMINPFDGNAFEFTGTVDSVDEDGIVQNVELNGGSSIPLLYIQSLVLGGYFDHGTNTIALPAIGGSGTGLELSCSFRLILNEGAM